jgi:hypothetical protein
MKTTLEMSAIQTAGCLGLRVALSVLGIVALVSLAVADGPPVSHMEQQKPLAKLGVSGSNPSETALACGAGTLGAILQDDKKAQYILSNAHVLAPLHEDDPTQSKGDAVYHAGVLDTPPPTCTAARGAIVAEVAYGVAINFGALGNRVDAAVAKIVDDQRLIKTTGDVLDIGPVGQPKATTNKLLGTGVKKSGRTSGLTFGTIISINDTQIISYTERDDKGMLAPKPATFGGLIAIAPRPAAGKSPVAFFSGPGDSGSLVVSDDDKNQPIGLLFGGDGPLTVANRICDVLISVG